jgi:hypothetical protein
MNPRQQTTAILRQVIRGEIKVQASNFPSVNMVVITGDTPSGSSFWICFFVDSDRLDYVDSALIDDELAEFVDFFRDDGISNPLDVLEPSEVEALVVVILDSKAKAPAALWNKWCNHPANRKPGRKEKYFPITLLPFLS